MFKVSVITKHMHQGIIGVRYQFVSVDLPVTVISVYVQPNKLNYWAVLMFKGVSPEALTC